MPSGPGAPQRAFIGSVLLFAIGLPAYAALWINVPEGFHPPYGLHPPSVALFREAWPYPRLSLSAPYFVIGGSAIVVLLWLAYGLAVAAVSFTDEADADRTARRALLVASAFVAFLVPFQPTILSGDIFHYALHGRMFSLYGLNPYTTQGGALPDDPYHYLSVWRDITTQYGPAWNLVAAAITRATGEQVLTTVIAFKAVAGIAHLACAVLIYRLARLFPSVRPDRAVVLFAWNPVLLIESAGSGHNDLVMLALALAAVLAFARGRASLAIALFAVSLAVKYLTALLAMLCIVFCLAPLSWRQRTQRIVLWSAIGVGSIALLYSPFWEGPESLRHFAGALEPQKNPMPNNVGMALRRSIDGWASSLAPTLATDLTIGGWSLDGGKLDGLTLLNAAFAALTLIAAGMLFRAAATWQTVMTSYGLLSFIYAYAVFAGSFPWYLFSPVAGAVLGTRGRVSFYLMAATIGLGLGFMLQNVQLIRV